jgi:hypothetical protein
MGRPLRNKSTSREIIFDGFKYFVGAELEIVLINHTNLLCLEVIVTVKDQVVRMYLDMPQLIAELDLVTINAQFMRRRVFLADNNHVFDSSQMLRILANQMIARMVVDRLEVTESLRRNILSSSEEEEEFDIFLMPTATDKICSNSGSTRLSFDLGERPLSLKPFNLLKHRILNIKQVQFHFSFFITIMIISSLSF